MRIALAPTRTRKNEKARAAIAANPSENAANAAFAADVGRLVRRGRARRGITRRQLAIESGISERYLAQIEGGAGNPSVIVLKTIAQAMEMHVTELLPIAGKRSEAIARINDLMRRLDASELPGIAQLIEQRLTEGARSQRSHRIALVGLRGAGKTTLGRALAEQLNWPFVEINRVIEQEYGATVSMLIDMSGVSAFRRYEQSALEKVITEHDKVVIATAGGIVSNPETYALLLRRSHTVWVKAKPQDHMSRVIAQGDFRPMAENRAAMADLVAILDARSSDYAQSEAELDTAGETVEQSLSKLTKLVQPWT
jgi:XRE family transcriptional regulator, aerobic/anaerobic benzoate catabolism transcriptional regulator